MTGQVHTLAGSFHIPEEASTVIRRCRSVDNCSVRLIALPSVLWFIPAIDRRTDELTDGPTDGLTDRATDGRTDGWTSIRERTVSRWTEEQTDREPGGKRHLTVVERIYERKVWTYRRKGG